MSIIEKPFKDRYDMGFYAGFKHAEKALYTLEDIRKAIDFNKYQTEYGNIVGGKPDQEIEDFIKSLKPQIAV